ncbi:MAG: site-specific integrase [Gemmatimonadetes bacterium]|nr:site-specific integrase [Gemmatimonadota bacterium]
MSEPAGSVASRETHRRIDHGEVLMAGWIIKTDGGRWKARLSITGAGTRNKTFDRKIDAEKWLRNEQARLDRSEWTDPRLARTTFADWAIPWLDTRRHLKPKTLAGYESLLTVHLLPRFGQLPLAAIDPLMIETWVVELTDNGLSASRTRQAYQLLSTILKAAVRARRLTSNPADGTPLPRTTRRVPRFLTSDQVDELADLVPRRYRGLIYLLAYGGLRWAEAVGLKVEYVNLLRRRIVVSETLSEVKGRLHPVPPKTWESRTIAIPPFVADVLGEHIGRFTGDTQDGLLFVTDNGTPLRSSNFRRWVWSPAVAKLGEEGLRIHDLRHTCASLLIAAGAHPGHVREHLGHSSIRVTMDVYGHLYDDVRDEIADRLERQRSR